MKTKRPQSIYSRLKFLPVVVAMVAFAGSIYTYRTVNHDATLAINGTSGYSSDDVNVESGTDPSLTSLPKTKKTTNHPTIAKTAPTSRSTVAKPTTSTTKTSAVHKSSTPPSGSDIASESACPGQTLVSQAKTVLVCMTSYARTHHGASVITANSLLMKAATKKAQDVINCGFSHTACGHSFDYWMNVYGYGGLCRGENLAMGQTTPHEAFVDWMNSAGHRANILNPSYRDIGIAAVSSSSGIVWVMELGGC